MVKFNLKGVKMKKVCMFLVLCLVAMGASGQGKSDGILIVAAGEDQDIGYYVPTHNAVTFIKAEWSEFAGGLPISGQVVFSTKIFDESGEKVYTIEGELELENAILVVPSVTPPVFLNNYCTVRDVTWIHYWLIMGPGLVKTTEAITIDYRGNIITLPDTGGEYMSKMIAVIVSPEGEFIEGLWTEGDYVSLFWGGWSWAGIVDLATGETFGGITWLRNFRDNRVP